MVFDYLLSRAIVAIAVLGHFGLWIWLYNRLNATGLKRKTIKRTEKAFVLACGLIPLVLLLIELRLNEEVFLIGVGYGWDKLTVITKTYSVIVMLFAVAMAPFWILDRPQLAISKNRFELINAEDLRHLQHPASNAALYVEGRSFRRMSKLPGNQIVSMQRNRKRLFIDSLPNDLNGLRIAHLSDVHLTGQLSTAFYRLAIDWLAVQSPHLVVVSGDIVDYETALKQIRPVFSNLQGSLGNYFVLGNHDKRLPVPTDVCDAFNAMGWNDLGRSNAFAKKGTTSIQLLGNELPWFERHALGSDLNSKNESIGLSWRLGVSHSPDQFAWGIANCCQLLLCGHTHGGQIRFPVIGPVIAPSRFGSRYASGVFSRGETLMHVSSGVSGIHPYRWGCMPEVTILELAPREKIVATV